MPEVVPISSARPGLRMEFDRQVQELIDLGYPELLSLDAGAFWSALQPLVPSLKSLPYTSAVRPDDHVHFVVVVNGLPLADAAALMSLKGNWARLMVTPDELKCFSLPASRRDDKQVPAIWISANAPKLGWCWNGNPHTWLGSASAGGRLSA